MYGFLLESIINFAQKDIADTSVGRELLVVWTQLNVLALGPRNE